MARSYRRERHGCRRWLLGGLLASLLAVAVLVGLWQQGWLSWERLRSWTSPERTEAPHDGGKPAYDAGPAAEASVPGPRDASAQQRTPASRDGGVAEHDAAASEPSRAMAPGVEVCPPEAAEPRIALLQIVAGGFPELLLACQGRVEAFGEGPEAGTWLRFAVFELDPEVPGTVPEPVVPVAGDVTGDGLPDLLLGSTFRGDGGTVAGGALHLIPQWAEGGFGEPRRLVGAAVLSVTTAQLDGRGGQEVLAVLRGNRLAGQQAEVRVWRGGVAPAPLMRRGLPADILAAAWRDLNGDGVLDLIGATPNRLLAVLSDGRGSLRTGSLSHEVPRLRGVAAFPTGWAAWVGSGVRLPAASVVLRWSGDDDAAEPMWLQPVLVADEAGPGAPLRRLASSGAGLWSTAGAEGSWIAQPNRGGGLHWERLPVPPGELASVAVWRERRWVLWREGAGRPWRLLVVDRSGIRPVRLADAPLVLRVHLP